MRSAIRRVFLPADKGAMQLRRQALMTDERMNSSEAHCPAVMLSREAREAGQRLGFPSTRCEKHKNTRFTTTKTPWRAALEARARPLSLEDAGRSQG